jgi:hypothetical protein
MLLVMIASISGSYRGRIGVDFAVKLGLKKRRAKSQRWRSRRNARRGERIPSSFGAPCSKEKTVDKSRRNMENVGRGGWRGVLTRELERIILGQCERQKDIEWMRKEVSRIDPTYVGTWDELKEGIEKQYSRTGIASWKAGHQGRDPWTPFRKCEGMKIPLRKPHCGL